MGGEVDHHRQGLAAHIIKAHHTEVAVAWFGFDLRMPIAVAMFEPNRAGGHLRRRQLAVGFDNGLRDAVLHLLVVTKRRVVFPLAFAGFIREFEHRPMVGVGARDEGIVDSRLGLDASANDLQLRLRRRAPQIQPYDRQLVRAGLDHHRRSVKGIKDARGQFVVSRPIAPHRNPFLRGNVPFSGANLENTRLIFRRTKDGEYEQRGDQQPTASRQFHAATLAQEPHARQGFSCSAWHISPAPPDREPSRFAAAAKQWGARMLSRAPLAGWALRTGTVRAPFPAGRAWR